MTLLALILVMAVLPLLVLVAILKVSKKTLYALPLAFLAYSGHAQVLSLTGTNNFFQSTLLYLGSHNTNLFTFRADDKIDVWTGAEYVNNLNTCVSLGVSYNAFTLSTNASGGTVIGFEALTRNASIAGTILSQGGGVNLQYIVWDVKMVGFAEGGYDYSLSKPYGEVGARVLKAISDNTFAGVGISERFGNKTMSSMPTFSVLAGFKL